MSDRGCANVEETRSETRRGILVVISGPSGTGKSTICRRLVELDPTITLSVSATTRPPRRGEQNGRDYYFISREEFENRVRRGDFVEWAEYAGNLYGTLKSEIERGARDASALVMDIDVQGGEQVMRAYPDAVTIFLEPPSFDELVRRLDRRGTDSPEAKLRRIEIARREMERRGSYHYRVVNDDLDRAVREVYDIIREHRKTA